MTAPAAASHPSGHVAIAVTGVTLALLTAACGVVGARDGLVHAGALRGRPWLDSAVEGLDGLEPQWWAVPLGAAAMVLGGWLLLAVVRRGSRTALPLTSRTGVLLPRRAVNRLAAGAAQDVDGVLAARARLGRGGRGIDVSARVTGDPATTRQDVQHAVEERLAALQVPLRVRATTRTESLR